MGFLGIMSVWAVAVGEMSRTAMACLFSSIFVDGMSPSMIALKTGFWGFCCCFCS